MIGTEFVALAVARLARSVRLAEDHGWTRSASDDPIVREQGVLGRLIRLTHPDAPFPLILFRGENRALLCALHRDTRQGFVWVEVSQDETAVAEVIDDAPVVAHLVARLADRFATGICSDGTSASEGASRHPEMSTSRASQSND